MPLPRYDKQLETVVARDWWPDFDVEPDVMTPTPLALATPCRCSNTVVGEDNVCWRCGREAPAAPVRASR